MKIDYSKIFPPGEKRERPKKEAYSSGVFPGFYTGIFFLAPFLLCYYVHKQALAFFLEPQYHRQAYMVGTLFFLLTFTLGIASDIKQPFNTVSNKQHRKGAFLRSCAFLLMVFYVLVAAGIVLFSLTHPTKMNTFLDTL